MAAALEEAWSRLRLTEEEEKVMLLEDEVQNDKDEDIALCLLGKLSSMSSFNVGW